MQDWVAWSTEVNCCRHRYASQAKDADRLEPKRYVVSCAFLLLRRTRISRSPVYRQDLPHLLWCVRNTVSPTSRRQRQVDRKED